jgi:arylsulfatase A-like enzyme
VDPDVLLIVCDTARADAFAPWGGPVPTPTMARLAREGVVYDRAISPAPWTLPSHGSLFTGLLPTEHGIVGDRLAWSGSGPAGPAPLTRAFRGHWLPEAMAERGYRTFGVSCNPWIGPWGGFDRGFDTFADVLPRPAAAATAGRVRRLVGRIRSLARGGGHGGPAALSAVHEALRAPDPRPVFGFVNLMEVHSPYDPPRALHPAPFDPRLRYRQLLQMGRFRTRTDASYVAAVRSLYFAAAREEDRIVGAIVGAVAARDRPAIVVIVSDHGENLGDHGLWGHHSSMHETLLHVPLLIWGSHGELGPARIPGAISTAVLARWIPQAVDAPPLEPPTPSGGPVVSEYESAVGQFGSDLPPEVRRGGPALVRAPGVAIRIGDRKYVATSGGPASTVDLAADPSETGVRAEEDPRSAEGFGAEVERWRERRRAMEAGGSADAGSRIDADEEIAAHLRELGYLE